MTTYPFNYVKQTVINFNTDGTFASATQAVATVTALNTETVAAPVAVLSPALTTFLGGFTGLAASITALNAALAVANAGSAATLANELWNVPATPNSPNKPFG